MYLQGLSPTAAIQRIVAIRGCYKSYSDATLLREVCAELTSYANTFAEDGAVLTAMCESIDSLVSYSDDSRLTMLTLIDVGAVSSVMHTIARFGDSVPVKKHACNTFLNMLAGYKYDYYVDSKESVNVRRRLLDAIQAIPGALNRLLQYTQPEPELETDRYRSSSDRVSKQDLGKMRRLINVAQLEVNASSLSRQLCFMCDSVCLCLTLPSDFACCQCSQCTP